MSPIEQDRYVQRELCNFKAQLRAKKAPKASPLVHAVTQRIHGRLFSCDLRVEAVLKACGVTSPTFSQRFKHYHGQTPYQYIQQRRMEAAERLLRCVELDLFLVALSLGYEYYRTFARALKRHAGCSPSQYRERATG